MGGLVGCHIPLQTVLCARMGEYGCVCTNLCACFLSCVCSQCRSVSVVCECCSPCCLLCPLCMQQKHSCNRPSRRLTGCDGGWGGAKEVGRVKGDVLACFLLYVQTLLAQGQIPSVYRMPYPLWQFYFYIYVCDALHIIILIHGCPWSCHFLFMSVYICMYISTSISSTYIVCICIRTTVMKPFKACVHGWIIN